MYRLVFYCLFDAVKYFVGSETNANILISLIADIKVSQWIPIVFGLGGFAFGTIKHIQLKYTRKRHSEYIRKLEFKFDSARQNSRLNEYGETHEDDR